MAYTGNISLIRELFVFALVLSFKYLCLLYIINVILSFFTIFYYAISSSFKAKLYLIFLLNRIVLRLWYVSLAYETQKCLLLQNIKVCNMKPYYNLESCFICLVTMVISFWILNLSDLLT